MSSHDGHSQAGTPGAVPTSHAAGKGRGKPGNLQPKLSFPSGPWREEVKARSTRLEAEARWIRDGDRQSDKHELMDSQIFGPLATLDRVLVESPRWNMLKKLRLWFHGSEVEECWRLLRQAEEGLVVVDDQRVLAHAELALAHGNMVLGGTNPIVRHLAKQLQDADPNADGPKAALQKAAFDVLSKAHEVTDQKHRQMRGFRNQLLGLSGVLLILAAVLLLLQLLVMSAPLVPPPAEESWHPEPTVTLGLVMFFGCIGALFSAVPSLAQIPETDYAFELVRAQAILKCVIGMWSAVVGILVVKAAVVGSTPQADSSTLAGLFIVAALFGAGQEAITRFADHKATTIRSGVQAP